MKKRLIMCFVIFSLGIQHFTFVSAKSTDEWKAAFIKDGDLWIKIGDIEKRITHDE